MRTLDTDGKEMDQWRGGPRQSMRAGTVWGVSRGASMVRNATASPRQTTSGMAWPPEN